MTADEVLANQRAQAHQHKKERLAALLHPQTAGSVIHNQYPCCNRAASLRAEPGDTGRRCKSCGRSYNVTIAPSQVLDPAKYGVILVATWTDRQYRKR